MRIIDIRLIIAFFKLARLFDELARQLDEGRLHVDFLRLLGELQALLGLIPVFLRLAFKAVLVLGPLCLEPGTHAYVPPPKHEKCSK